MDFEIPTSDDVELRTVRDGYGVFTKNFFGRGDVVIAFKPQFDTVPSRMTIQVAKDLHLRTDESCGAYVNHSCEPTCIFDADRLAFVADRPLVPGDEVTFNYLTTEWDMASPFACACGSPRCVGKISGARYLARQQWEQSTSVL